ncbi:MAG: TaqI-like C-terminal specificity domain-containing protein [Nitrospiraceae bacterium]
MKTAIGSGALGRLRARANKSRSEVITIPKEYLGHPRLIEVVQHIVDTFKSEHLDLEITMFFLSLRVLELRGEVLRTPFASIHDPSSFQSWRRNSIKSEITHWQPPLASQADKRGYRTIYLSFNSVEDEDFLGFVYQSLCKEGDKANKGSYYTPSSVIRDSLCQQTFSGESFLDPCCGTGNYLISASKILHLSPDKIYGFDSDSIAVRVARINFLLAHPSYDSIPNIECLNTLTDLATGDLLCGTNHLLSNVDFIATNPPWGAYKNAPMPVNESSGITSKEAFSLFLSKALTLLRDGGVLSFVLPESFLKIRAHRDIRTLVLANTKIVRIVKLGRPFAGVFTPAIRFDAIKARADREWTVAIQEKGRMFHVEQSRFLENGHHSFDVNVTSREDDLIKKLFRRKHVTLSGHAQWALGIVTGNNELHVRDQEEDGMEPVIRGSDISKFVVRAPQSFIRFNPNSFQQVARESYYRTPEKLIYKFISKSLVFAYDNKKMLTLNSANLLIPKLPEHGAKVVLAFLNSSVFQYIFMKKFSTHKVLRGDLERLPFPVLPTYCYKRIEMLVDEVISGQHGTEELEELIFSSFHLTDAEIQEIKLAVKDK